MNMRSRLVHFDLATGLSPDAKPLQRRLSQMRGMFLDEERRCRMAAEQDLVVYEFYDLGVPQTSGDVAFGTSVIYPGKVGDEYFMTKGHFHSVLDTAEVYFCIRGSGYLLMESPQGDVEAQVLSAGAAVYVPGRYAHRTINVSSEEPLVTFFAFRADAGHDYAKIETKGFRTLVVDRDGAPDLIDNPRR